MLTTRRQSAAAVVEAYILSRQPWVLPLSTSTIVQHLRETLVDCEHTDEELVQLVAICAIRNRCPLAFDGPFDPEKKPRSLPAAAE